MKTPEQMHEQENVKIRIYKKPDSNKAGLVAIR
jgi:hypothetical protein